MYKTIIMPVAELAETMRKQTDRKAGSLQTSGVQANVVMNLISDADINNTDRVKFILLADQDLCSRPDEKMESFRETLEAIKEKTGAAMEFQVLDAAPKCKGDLYEKLLDRLISQIANGSHLYVDLTSAPRDFGYVMFVALSFAEQNLDCEVERLIIRTEQTDAPVADLTPLFGLHTLLNRIQCRGTEDARKLLKTLVVL